MNYCPVCKREYKEMGKNQAGRCPVCGSTLDQKTGNAIENERRENIQKKNEPDRSYGEVKS